MTTKVPSVILTNRLLVPIKFIDAETIKKNFDKRVYNLKNCQRCEYRHERHSEWCDPCENYKGHFVTYKKVERNDKKYWSLPRAELYRLKALGISKYKLINKMTRGTRLSRKLELTKKLYDYQEKCRKDMIEGDGRKDFFPHGILKAAPRSGKCVTGDTLVATANGITPIRDLFDKRHKAGKTIQHSVSILTREGVEETSHLYKKKVDITVRVKTAHGYQVRGTENHPVLVLTPKLTHEWKNLSDVKVGDVLCVNRAHRLFSATNATIPYVSAQGGANAVPLSKYPTQMTPKLARLLGYLVANGALNTAASGGRWFSFSTQNTKIQDDILKIVRSEFGVSAKFDGARTPNVQFTSTELIAFLKASGLIFSNASGKAIPNLVLKSNESVVRSFLTGYLSCDSCLDHGHIQLCSASRKLMRQMQTLFLSFGIVSKLTTKLSWARNSSNPVKRNYYNLFINGTNRDVFVKEFGSKLKKPFDLGNMVHVRHHDVVPFLGAQLRNTFHKYHLGSGMYNVSGNRKMLRLYALSKKGIGNLADDLAVRDIAAINKSDLTQLNPKLVRKIKKIESDNLFYDKVVESTTIKKPVTVYDVTVPGSHSFIGNGLVVHNTLTSLAIAIKRGRKTLILAKQDDLLKQFLIELKDSTNVMDIDKFEGKVSFGICSKVEDFEKYDICLATYQTFISPKGKKKLKAICKLFGTVFVDEAHGVAAGAFSKVVDSFHAEARFGLTATDKRKDQLDFITRQILGDVVTEAKVQSLIPKVVVVPTGITPRHPYKTWNGAMQFLFNSPERTDLILKWVKKDLKEGRKIVIPCVFKKQVHLLVEKIRKMGYTAEPFIGGTNREDLLKKARAGKIDVVVGIRSILSTGVNVPCWSVIYTQAPISNAPNYYQETTRVCTPLEGKPQPIIRLFVDPMPMTKGCFRTCWTQTVLPMGYQFSEKTKERAKEILSTMRSYKEDPAEDEAGSVYRDEKIFNTKRKSGGVGASGKHFSTVNKKVRTVTAKLQLTGLF